MPGTPGILRLGRSAALDVPRTLVSNDPAAIRTFVASCRAGAIRKMLHSSSVEVTEADGTTHMGATEAVTPDDLRDDPTLRACPLIWQERVPKARELWVTAVGRALFVASIRSGDSARGAVDWRQDSALVGAFQPDVLPPSVEAACHRLLDRLALNFATIDLIRTPDGRYVLLEVTATSFFHFVERATGLPIADALAGLLAGERAPRVGAEP